MDVATMCIRTGKVDNEYGDYRSLIEESELDDYGLALEKRLRDAGDPCATLR